MVGRVRIALLWMPRTGLEWAFRLSLEPRRCSRDMPAMPASCCG
ncbi:MAG: hypothetical protein JO161_11145 [Planctomycetaceae bacterium]|nr:hypothetical protein [Planctomycetaceae bacterium]